MASGTLPEGGGAPPPMAHKRIRSLADRLSSKSMLIPRKLRDRIRKKANCEYSMCSIRRTLCGRITPKYSVTEHSPAADADTVRQWQADAVGTIRGAKR